MLQLFHLTHWGRVTHICVGKLTIIGSDNGLAPGRRQAIIWTNAAVLLIGPLGINFNEILIEIHTFSFKKMHIKMLSGKWRPFCLGLNVLTYPGICTSGLVQHNSRWWFVAWSTSKVWVGAKQVTNWQAITLTNINDVLWHYWVSLGHNYITCKKHVDKFENQREWWTE